MGVGDAGGKEDDRIENRSGDRRMSDVPTYSKFIGQNMAAILV